MRHSRNTRRGFATIMAVALIGIAATAAAVLTASVGSDYRRTQRAAEDAQLRQLLLVAQFSLQDRMGKWEGMVTVEAWAPALPPDLLNDAQAMKAVSIKIETSSKGARIEATVHRHHVVEEIRIERADGKWRISGMTIMP